MGAILPSHPLAVDQAQVGFMDQSRRLKTVTGPLAVHVMMREAAEFCVDDRDQIFERIAVTAGPGVEQLAYIIHGL